MGSGTSQADAASAKTTSSGRRKQGGGGAGGGGVQVHIQKGILAHFVADVLVNSTSANLDLNSGGLSKSLLCTGGEILQEECNYLYPNGISSGQVAVTNGGKLKCRKVYHGTFLPWQRGQEATLLKDMCTFVCECLNLADRYRVTSIAFPTLGTNRLDYPADKVAKTIVSCVNKYISISQHRNIKLITIVVFERDRNYDNVKKAFENELPNVRKTSKTFSKPVPTPGTPDYFKHLYSADPFPPSYWTSCPKGLTLKEWISQNRRNHVRVIDVDRTSFSDIEQLIRSTWPNVTNLKINKIERIENRKVFEKYAILRQTLFHKISSGKNRSLRRLEASPGGTGPVLTTKNTKVKSVLSRDIFTEINEHFLFHGTGEDAVKAIINQGMDIRMAGSNTWFGMGVYAAEQPAKADYHAGKSATREKKMVLLRMCLGEIYVQTTRKVFKREPCRDCFKDDCSHGKFFDSVVFDDGGSSAREFIVYKNEHAYPEYLITYET